MKKSTGTILLAACFLYMLTNAVHDFIDSDGFHYFAQQPSRIILTFAIGVAGGLFTLVFMRLSPRLRRLLELCTFAFAAVCFFVFASYLYYEFHFGFITKSPIALTPRYFEFVPLAPLSAAVFFSLLFYLNIRRRIEG